MKWTPRRIIALVLGAWIALAPVALIGPAAAMTAQMSMTDNVGAGGCCPNADINHDNCALMCANSLLFTLAPERGSARLVVFRVIEWPVRYLSLTGINLAPDPGPPRSAWL
jgi:hypothetical protein